MKKLLKFGIASLSLTTLGVVGQLTELPVFGTQVVRAEDSVAETIRVIKYYQDSETGGHIIPATVVEVPKSENYSIVADAIDGYTPVRHNVTAQSFLWSTDGDGNVANFSHASAFANGEWSVDVAFYYTKNPTPPVETPEGEGGGETETPPADNPDSEGSGETQTPPVAKSVMVTLNHKLIGVSQDSGDRVLYSEDVPLYENGSIFVEPKTFPGVVPTTEPFSLSYDEVVSSGIYYTHINYRSVDKPVDGGKEIYTNTTNEPIGVAVYYVGENLDGAKVKLLDSDLIITVNPGEEVSALRDFDGYTLDSTSYTPPLFSEGILTYSYKQDTPPADNPGDSDGGDKQTPPNIQSTVVTISHVLVGVSQDSGDSVLLHEDVTLYENGSIFVEPKTFPGTVPVTEPFSLSYDEVVESGVYYTHVKYRLADKTADNGGTPTPAPETPEERQARINHNLRVLRSEVERVERALTYPKLTPAEVAALEAFKAKRLETIASLEQTGELGDDNLTEADIKAFDTVLALELAGVFNDKDAEQPISTPAPKDLSADRNKLLLSVDESGLTDQQKGELAIKITFAETEKDLADLKAELMKLVKAAEKPANKPAKEAPKTESKAPAAAAKPAANSPAKSDKAALPATGDVTRVGLIAAGFSLLLLGLGLAKSRKHN